MGNDSRRNKQVSPVSGRFHERDVTVLVVACHIQLNTSYMSFSCNPRTA